MFLQGTQLPDDLLAQGAGVLFFTFGESEGAIGLKITIRRVCHAHLGLEASLEQSKLAGGAPEGRVEVAGDVEREGHRVIQELRLALSKKDFCGLLCRGI
jgi:hypothetical protein